MKSFYVHFYRCKLTLTECLLFRKTWNFQGIFFHDLSNILFNLGLTYIFFIFFLIFKTKKRENKIKPKLKLIYIEMDIKRIIAII